MKSKGILAFVCGICLAFLGWSLKKSAAPHYTLAVLVRNAPLAQRIYEGMREEMAKSKSARFELKFFDTASVDKIQVQTVVEEMLAQRPDLIFSIGVLFTQMCVNTIKKRVLTIPVVCGVSGDPVKQGVVTKLAKREEAVTGVNVAPPSNLMPVELLLQAKPAAKNVLIPYFSSSLGGEMSKSAEETADLFAQRGVRAYLLPLNAISEVNAMVSGMIHKVDTIMCLSGDRIDDAYSVLAKLCDTYGVTLFAKDLEAAKTGAALSFGLSLKEIGVKMMQYAYHILVRGVRAGDLPLLFMNGHRILILNKTAAAKQGLEVTPELLALADQVVE